MNFFMATIMIPEDPADEFWNLIPSQRSQINDWIQEGIVQVYSLSADRTYLWVIFYAESYEKVDAYIKAMPMVDYFDSYDIAELAMHQNVSMMPVMSLN